jgi:hypothetical protein
MQPYTKFLVIKDEFSGDKKIATTIARTKPLIIVPLTEVKGFIILIFFSFKECNYKLFIIF